MLGLCCVALGGSCSESESDRAGAWQEVLRDVDWGQAPAIFAPKYVDANQDNDVWSTLVFSGVSNPCSELFTPDQESTNRREFWYLNVEFPKNLSQVEKAALDVRITHVKNGTKELSIRAKNAQIDQLSGFEREAQGNGEYLLKAWFPKKPHKSLSCSGTKSKSGEQTGSCVCEDGDGQQYTCEQVDNFDEPCCDKDSGAGEIPFTARIRASYCKEACSEAVGLGRCGKLREGTGLR